ncbi:Neurogenic locus notchprotein 4 [Manis javanica]|nr:Neurogenic locus notchprotein 4 [Manis javanica]
MGFTGLDCEMNPEQLCGHQCQNGATCQDELDTYTCLCPEAWTGLLCHMEDMCLSQPCHREAQCSTSP